MLQKLFHILFNRFESQGKEGIEIYFAQDTNTIAFRALKKTPGQKSSRFIVAGECPGEGFEQAKEAFVSTARRILEAPYLQVNERRVFSTKQDLQTYARNNGVWWLIDKV